HLPRPFRVQAQIAIPQQFLLHERTQRPAVRHPGILERLRPRTQDLFVDVVDHAVHVEARELADQAALEAGFEVEEVREDGGEGALRRVAAVDDVEGPAGQARLLRRCDGSAPLRRRPRGRADILHMHSVDA
ncbi:MAG: hypothetical protein LQ352_004145, partial [Teloschistes flavicans]